MTSKLSAFP